METYIIDRPLIQTSNLLGESPLWDPVRQMLFWIDIDRGLLHSFHPETGSIRIDEIGQKLGCIALTNKDDLLLATELGFAFYKPGSPAPENFLNVIPPNQGLMFNDGKVSPTGEFWVGSKGPRGKASLYRLCGDLTCHVILDVISISNGVGWTSDGRFFYHTDSQDRKIYRYTLCGGKPTNRETFYIPSEGTPDGLSLDTEGNLWVAIWDGWRVVQLSPAGEELAQILLPISRPTSVAFGGKDLKTLYITSASVDLTPAELADQPYAGALFSIALSAQGVPSERFMLRA